MCFLLQDSSLLSTTVKWWTQEIVVHENPRSILKPARLAPTTIPSSLRTLIFTILMWIRVVFCICVILLCCNMDELSSFSSTNANKSCHSLDFEWPYAELCKILFCVKSSWWMPKLLTLDSRHFKQCNNHQNNHWIDHCQAASSSCHKPGLHFPGSPWPHQYGRLPAMLSISWLLSDCRGYA